jgi:predicted metal-dependent hydrolase
MSRAAAKHLADILEVPELPVPLYIYFDRGKNIRIRLVESKAVLTMPLFVYENDKNRYIAWAVDWVRKKTQKERFQRTQEKRTFKDGDQLVLMGRPVLFKLEEQPLHISKAQMRATQSEFHMRIPANWDETEKQDAIRVLLRKAIAKTFHKPLYQRVEQLNHQHFGYEVQQMRLKYNKSNWGSCSSRGNLNFSIRLLFAPIDVIDSVILHELVHFEHMNHSSGFWQRLAEVDPNLQSSETWLKANSFTDLI